MSLKNRLNALLALLLGCGSWSAQASGAPRPGQSTVDEALQFFGRVNAASLLEPAGSHGSIGTDVGAGMVSVTPPEHNALLNSQLGDDRSGKSVGIPRIWLLRGLPIPVDAGITAAGPAGSGKGSAFTQVSAALQWTVYEALARPALTLRGSYGKLYGVTGTTLTSAGGEVVVSYGVLSYLTFYGRIGAVQHEGSVTIQPQQFDSLQLAESGSSPLSFRSSWLEPVRAAGIRLRFGATRLTITGEADLEAGVNHADYGAKISYAL
jgi:hypothetical protein